MPVAARRALRCIAIAVLALAGVRARAQSSPPPPPASASPSGDTLVSLDFQDADITEVISTIAKATGKNFLYDDRVRGRVTVISPDPVTVDEAYRVFESILAVKGFTTVPAPGGVLKILPLRDAKENPIETVPSGQQPENRDTFITRLLPLHYVKADAISDTLKPLVSKEASVIAYGPTNTLIITDSSANIVRLSEIIDQIDVSTYQEQVKLIPIQYADAQALTQQLQQIFGDDSGGGPGGARRARAAPQATPTAVPGVPGSDAVIGSAGEPRFIPDVRTNAIVVIATKAVLHEIERIIGLLDYKRKGAGRIHVYRLKNADADEISQTLSSLASGSPGSRLGLGGGTTRTSLTGSSGLGGTGGLSGLGGTGSTNPAGSALGGLGGGLGGSSAVADLGDGVRITSDPPTNSLIIQANAEAFATISEVIEALDVRRPQVMVEALIMEVQATPSNDLGAAWITTMATRDGSTVGIGSSSLDPNTVGAISSLAGGTGSVGNFAAALLGRTVSIPDPNNPGSFIQVPWIRALITASESDQNTNIISAPTILTADKKEAEIVVGQNIPVPTSRLQAAGTTIDPNNPFQTSQNIARQDVGVTLRVTPQISEGDTVRLNVFQEISGVIPPPPGSDTTLGPTTSDRKVENTVYVRDGEAVMIGGILSDNQNDSETKVPWLGDIPVIGWAFKGTHNDNSKINLLIILTPRIVRDPQDLERLTVENRERFKSASAPAIDLSDEEKEERRKALEAGVPLPIDPNPVRRELERHDQRYPVEKLPELRQQASDREKQREHDIEELKKKEAGGSYLVQVAHFATAEEAVALLQKLMADGYDGTVFSESEQGETTHWVQLGPFSDQAKAQAVARDLNASRGMQSLVVVQP
ncbi:MAG TPA: type II secretion system secretin GspD [Myxococcota bacterium]|nr:type II secretion system secretin GspD [Myxococcota bacterium]